MEKYITRALLVIIFIGTLTLVVLGILVIKELSPTEFHLNADGSAFEINPDEMGRLWISDFKAKQVWAIDPKTSDYKIYPVNGSPVDARQVDGWLWWVDGQSNLISRVSINDGTFIEWQVPTANGFLGTNLDDQGRLYATDSSNPYLYRLDALKAELCTITLSGFGAGNYIVRDKDDLWIGDWFDSTLLRFRPNDNSLTWWILPPGSSPFGMTVDSQGYIWYADQGEKMLAQLDPGTNQLNAYLLTDGNYPKMIAAQSGEIWYTEQSLPSLGRLDPVTAAHESVILIVHNQQLSPNCERVSPSSSGSISISSGKLSLRSKTYPVTVNEDGWQIYQLPEGSDPWGIALTDYGYLVDAGRQVFIRFDPNQ